MKDYKRAYRRYKKHVKFVRRFKNWIKPGIKLYYDSEMHRVYDADREEIFQMALKGECYTWLRTTGNPCNCFCCSEDNKYVRTPKQYINKEIKNRIYEE